MVITDKFEGDVAKTVALYAAISDVLVPAFHLIEFDDFNAISEIVAPLLGESRPEANGSTS